MKWLIGVVLLVAIILWSTVVMMKRRGDRDVKARSVIPIYGAGCVALVLFPFAVYVILSLRVYDLCTARRESRENFRSSQEQLFDTIDQATRTTHWTTDVIVPGRLSLRGFLEAEYPPIPKSECDDLNPLEGIIS